MPYVWNSGKAAELQICGITKKKRCSPFLDYTALYIEYFLIGFPSSDDTLSFSCHSLQIGLKPFTVRL